MSAIEKATEATHVARPAVDIYEDERGFVLFADLPGVAQEGLEIEIDKGRMRLTGQRAYGEGLLEYKRVFQVPSDTDPDAVTAALERGVLRVTLPRAAAHIPRRIDITVA